VDDCHACFVFDDANFQGRAGSRRGDEHCDLRVVGPNARQWCRIACSMSSSVTPCVRAAGSASTPTAYGHDNRSSTHVDDRRDEPIGSYGPASSQCGSVLRQRPNRVAASARAATAGRGPRSA
jgi:hypothetical protein